MTVSSTELFTDRARDYADHRPGYPLEVFRVLTDRVPLPACAIDIGAGTGIFSRSLLASGYKTISVEPNEAMRIEARAGSSDPTYLVVAGTGEDTGLADACAELITVAQAFHWLDLDQARAELFRIGKPGCMTAIVWNTRQFDASPFMREYREMLFKYAPDYRSMKSHWDDLDGRVRSFFPQEPELHGFSNRHLVPRDSMIGNLLSTSYAPKPATLERDELLKAADKLFERHQIDGTVGFELMTKLYIGSLAQMFGLNNFRSVP